DLFVRATGSSTIQFDVEGSGLRPSGRVVAYGLHVGADCEINATHAVVDRGGFGFFNAGGVLTLRGGLISNQLVAAGAAHAQDRSRAVVLDGVDYANNHSDAVLWDLDLPEAASLPPPTGVCETAGCE